MSQTNYNHRAMIELATEIREALPYLANLPADTAELVEGVIRRLELGRLRAEHAALMDRVEAEAEVPKAADSILAREKACARRAGELAAVEAVEAKAKAPKGKRRGAAVTVEVEAGHHVVVRPGLSIRLWGVDHNRVGGPVEYDRTFEVGDTVAMDSYNLVYMGQIERIGAKTVTIRGNLGVKRLSLEKFSWRNRHFDVETAARRNHEESYCI